VAVTGRRYAVASGIVLLSLAVVLFFFLDFRGYLSTVGSRFSERLRTRRTPPPLWRNPQTIRL
jgi:hypothetical protein